MSCGNKHIAFHFGLELSTLIFVLAHLYYSFRDESDNSFEGDVILLMVGVGIIITYVAIILGRFNEVEHRVNYTSCFTSIPLDYLCLK